MQYVDRQQQTINASKNTTKTINHRVFRCKQSIGMGYVSQTTCRWFWVKKKRPKFNEVFIKIFGEEGDIGNILEVGIS